MLIYLLIFKIRTPTDHISQLKKINNGGRIHEIIGGYFICGYPDCSRGVDWSGEGWNGQTVTQSLADSRYLARKRPVAQAGVSGLNFISRNPTAHEGHKTRNRECCEFTPGCRNRSYLRGFEWLTESLFIAGHS